MPAVGRNAETVTGARHVNQVDYDPVDSDRTAIDFASPTNKPVIRDAECESDVQRLFHPAKRRGGGKA